MLFMFMCDINISNYNLSSGELKPICFNYCNFMKKISFIFWMSINLLQTSLFLYLHLSILDMFLKNCPPNKKFHVLTFH